MIPALLLTIILHSCNPTESYNTSEITFTLADVSCTEAWLKVSTGTNDIKHIVIEKNGEGVTSFIPVSSDTVIYDNNLLPNTIYTYKAKYLYGNALLKTIELNVQTMDTTSHNITWEEFTFGGDYDRSYLNDVAIIDENNIWAVGEIFLNDSLGNNDYHRYNAIHWDGNNWEVKRITVEVDGYKRTPILEGVRAFGPENIWIVGNLPIHGDGEHWVMYDVRTITNSAVSLSKVWGQSPDDIYFVGDGGSLVHYSGNEWQVLSSGTDVRLTDIYGTQEGSIIWTCGWDNNYGSVILSIQNLTVNMIWDRTINFGDYNYKMQTVCTVGRQFWTAGNRIYKQSILFSDDGHRLSFHSDNDPNVSDQGNFVFSLRGTESNNIYIGGDYGMLWHFNGLNWHKYEELYNPIFDRRLESIAVIDNIVVAIGWKNSDAWIAVGRKYN